MDQSLQLYFRKVSLISAFISNVIILLEVQSLLELTSKLFQIVKILFADFNSFI